MSKQPPATRTESEARPLPAGAGVSLARTGEVGDADLAPGADAAKVAAGMPARGRRWLKLAALALLALVTLVLLALLAVRFVVWPQAGISRAWLESRASQMLEGEVTIESLETGWSGWHPVFRAAGIVLRTPSHGEVLRIGSADGRISLPSLLSGRTDFSRLQASDVAMRAWRERGGRILIAGQAVDGAAGGNERLADWIFSQREWRLENGEVRWLDEQRGLPEVRQRLRELRLRRAGRAHHVTLELAGETASAFTFSADFTHPFLAPPGRPENWSGKARWRLANTRLQDLQRDWAPFAAVRSGEVEARGTIDFTSGTMRGATLEAELRNGDLTLSEEDKALGLQRLALKARLEKGLPAAGLRSGKLWLDQLVWQAHAGANPARVNDALVKWSRRGEAFEHLELRAPTVDLGAAAVFAQLLPLPQQLQATLRGSQLQGTASEVESGWWAGDAAARSPVAPAFRVSASLAGFGVAVAGGPRDAGPVHISGLDGRIEFDHRGGRLRLDRLRSVSLPGILDAPQLRFDMARGAVNWAPAGSGWRVGIDSLGFANADAAGRLNGELGVVPGADGRLRAEDADLRANLERADVSRVVSYLPASIPVETRDYLRAALVSGRAADVRLALQGRLDDFPFDRERGQFRVEVPIRDVAFRPVPDATGTTAWPDFSGVSGKVVFDRAALQFDLDRAQVETSAGTVQLGRVTGGIADISAEGRAVLQVEGEAGGATRSFIAYANGTPVGEWIGGVLSEAQADGVGQLNLRLEMPLAQPDDSKVLGKLQLLNNRVGLFSDLPAFSELNGAVRFDQHGFTLKDMRGRFLGGQVQAEGGTQADGAVRIIARGRATVEGLREAYSHSAIQRIARRLSGATDYETTIRVQHGAPEITVDSQLRDLVIDLPAPLAKPANRAVPLRFVWKPVPAARGADADERSSGEEVAVQYGDVLGARFMQRRGAEGPTVLRGGIGVHAPVPTPEAGVVARLALDMLDIDAWRAALAEITGQNPSAEQQRDLDEAALRAMAYVPSRVEFRAEELRLLGRSLHKVVAGAAREGDNWEANVDSPLVSGNLRWRTQSPSTPYGEIVARLARLDIPDGKEGQALTGLLEERPAEIPGIDLVADDFRLFGKALGRLEVKARSLEVGGEPQWLLDHLRLRQPAAALQATGSWRVPGSVAGSAARTAPRRTSLNFRLDVADAGRLLEDLGLPQTLRGGLGRMEGRLHWHGTPFALDPPSMNGDVQFSLRDGQILKVDPGAAKLLGVLSLQGLAQLAVLDFRTLAATGMPFDEVMASGTIDRGIGKTSDFQMTSPQYTVRMRGTANIMQESQNLAVTVLPNVNAGSASLVYAIVNPLVGFGSLFAQLALSNQFAKMFRQEYVVTGAWAAPRVERLGLGSLPGRASQD